MPDRTARRPAGFTPGKKVHDKLVAELSAAVSTIKYGAGGRCQQRNRAADFASASATGWRFVERAAELKHIEITAGGKTPSGKGFFYQPTVVAGALQSDEIVRREVFGPVVSVTRFSDPDEAVALGQ